MSSLDVPIKKEVVDNLSDKQDSKSPSQEVILPLKNLKLESSVSLPRQLPDTKDHSEDSGYETDNNDSETTFPNLHIGTHDYENVDKDLSFFLKQIDKRNKRTKSLSPKKNLKKNPTLPMVQYKIQLAQKCAICDRYLEFGENTKKYNNPKSEYHNWDCHEKCL